MVAGETLKGRYRIDSYPLAHSGMGEVWRAHDTLLDRPVVVKFLRPTTDVDLVHRFRREALLTARLNHPGVPCIFDLNIDRGRPYLVLEMVDGITLADLAAEQDPLPIAWVTAIGAQIAAVLMAAETLGLVHRDIKPGNVMLEPSGAIRVLDFGLAAIHADPRYSRITRTGESLGTIGYMAPEQVDALPVDHRTDLYGLGGTLFHLLTGRPPFDGATTTTTLRRQFSDPPPRPSTLRPDLPAALDDLVHTLLTPDPQRRPGSATEVYAVLSTLTGPRPPIPGVIAEGDNAVRAYATAVAGQTPSSRRAPRPRDPQDATADDADRLFRAGKVRAAARLWRRLADRYAHQHGEDHPQVFDWRLRAARAHLRLGEHSRGVRQLEALLARRAQLVGPNDDAVRRLRREIARLRTQPGDSGPDVTEPAPAVPTADC